MPTTTTPASEPKQRKTRRRGNGEGSIYKRPDGRWSATITTSYGDGGKRKRKTVYGKSMKEVQTALTKLQADKRSNSLCDASRETVTQFLDRWLKDSARLKVQATTLEGYTSIVATHIAPRIGGVRLDKLTAAHVQWLQSDLESAGASPRTRQMVHAVLRRALNVAMKWSLVPRNVCHAIDPPKVGKRDMRPLSAQEADTLIANAESHRLAALFVVAINTGMRQGELFGLHWDAVDLEGRTLSVKQSLKSLKGGCKLGTPKTSKSRRRIDLGREVVAALHEHRKKMMAEGHAASPWVFCDRKGGHLRKSNFIRQIFKPLLKRAGLPDIRFHDLRHTAATLMLSENINPKVVQERLGHSTIAQTMDTYSHVLPSMSRNAADVLDDVLARARESRKAAANIAASA
jgi:integrase